MRRAALSIAALALTACNRIDAQDFPLPGGADVFQIASDQGAVFLTEAPTGSLRAIAQFRPPEPTVEAEVVEGSLQALSDCGGRDGCFVDWFAGLPRDVPGSIAAQSGQVDLGSGYTADVVVSVGTGSVTGDALEFANLDVTATEASIDLQFATPPERLDVAVDAGDIEVVVPAGSYRLDLLAPDGPVLEGIVDDPAAEAILRLSTGAGTLRLRGQ